MGTNKNLIQPSHDSKKYTSGMLGGYSGGKGNSSGASRGAKEMYVAMYDFAAETGEEMSVRKGEEMELVKILDDNWAEVSIGRSKGLVPRNYIKKASGGGRKAPPPAPTSRKEMYVALYDFVAQSRDELSIREGERMELVKNLDADWCEVAIGQDKGVVPRNYIQKC
jgi:hypothetical protein